MFKKRQRKRDCQQAGSLSGESKNGASNRPFFVNFPTPDISQGLPGLSAHQKTLNGDRVYPGRAGTPGQGHQESAALPGQQPLPLDGRQLRLIPDLSAAALRRKKHKELALWHRLRALGQPAGTGVLRYEFAIQGLVETFGYSPRTAYRHLALAEGRLWHRTTHRTGPVIEIYGLKTACEYLGTRLNQGDRHYRELPASAFQLGQERAQLLASIHKPEGIRANPISRQSIEGYTGVGRRQQLRYDRKAGVRKTPGHGVLQVKDKDGGTRIVPERQLIVTKTKQYWRNKRMPNTYHSQAGASSRGMLKRVGSQLRGFLIPDEAIPNRRYFKGHKSLLQSAREHFRRERYLPFEGYRLLRNNQRLIRGRIEWCREVVCV
ncbi:hypothetical protein ES708_08585 [subsurface metagenome]